MPPIANLSEESAAFVHQANNECLVLVRNIPLNATKEDLETCCEAVGSVKEVKFVHEKAASKPASKAFVEYYDASCAQRAVDELHEFELHGGKLKFELNVNSKGGGKSEKRQNKIQSITVFVDELDMPCRPQINPSPSDREVWVREGLDEYEARDAWLNDIGDVENIYCLKDSTSGESLDCGYVRFVEHSAAARCVELGCGTWSESERWIGDSTRPGQQRWENAYRENVVALIVGKGGENIKKLTEEIGAHNLHICGYGVKSGFGDTDRIHFVCRGSEESVSKLRPRLQSILSTIHSNIAAGRPSELFAAEVPRRKRKRGIGNPYVDAFSEDDEDCEEEIGEAEIERLIVQRNEARKSGNFRKADEIRDSLKERGVVLMDEKKAKGSASEVTKWRFWRP